ncbi:hypothetical protein EJ03DRAFT_325704 [Teratosphaeria nubilosa]|uniref:Uncharacterized protein n=1 Tax=Teratosphaeria nubilosa TaxID=161662 RepID=A0A6G1LFQ4_9PEZI|nr:hypothetical protein EJ03DRAFT_325704 [Teratosphaeria nubilosa]
MVDPNGRILVTTNGVLPAREITDKYHHRTFGEDFDTAHPVFNWIYRVSRNWSGVSDLIPRMKSHLQALRIESNDNSRPSSSPSSERFDPDTFDDYSIIFRERFCSAAASLANAVHIPIERMGVLYDKIIETGTISDNDYFNKSAVVRFKVDDVEKGSAKRVWLFGKGQLLLLTKQLSQEETDKLLNSGYKFGSVQHVGRSISQPIQVPLEDIEKHFTDIKQYVDNLHTSDKTGTWLGFFGLIARTGSKGFDIGVKRDNQDQLPDVQLMPAEPQDWQSRFLERLDGMKTKACLFFLEDKYATDMQRTEQERRFAKEVREAMTRLGEQVPAACFQEARFLAKPVSAHYCHRHRSRNVITWIYALCLIADVHTSIEEKPNLARIPLTFFGTRQRCYRGSPDHAILSRDIHQEFGPLLARRQDKRKLSISGLIKHKTGLESSRKYGSQTPLGNLRSSRKNSLAQMSPASSVHELVAKPSRISDCRAEGSSFVRLDRDNMLGGIYVTTETVVESDSGSSNSSSQGGGKFTNRPTSVSISTLQQEDTFVDELVEATRTRFVPPKIRH